MVKRYIEIIKPHAPAILISLFMLQFWLNMLWAKFINLGYYDWDFALYANAMWGLSRGTINSSLFGTSFLSNHTEYIAFLIAPIYFLFSHPFTLIVLKILVFVISGYFIYLIGAQALNRKWGCLFLVLFYFYPANLFMMIYEFHFENFALLPVVLSFYFLRNNRFIPYLCSIFIGCLIKENIALVITFFGFYALIVKRKNWKWAIAPLTIGALVFCLDVFVVMPHFRKLNMIGDTNQYLSLYSSYLNVNIPIISKLKAVFAPPNLYYLIQVFGPFNILAFPNPLALIPAIPLFSQHMLASAYQMKTPFYHYMATISPFICLASIDSVKLLTSSARRIPTVVFAILLLGSTSLTIFQHLSHFNIKISAWFSPHDADNKQLVNYLQSKDRVAATFDFLAPLSNRDHLVSFHQIWENSNIFSKKPPALNDLEYALIDWENNWLISAAHVESKKHQKRIIKNINNFYTNFNWKIIAAYNNTTLLKKDPASSADKLVEVISPSQLPPTQLPKKVVLDKSIALRSYEIDTSENTFPGVFRLTLYWECLQETDNLYQIYLAVKGSNNDLVAQTNHHIGYFIYPTTTWKQGEIIKETYFLSITSIPAGSYDIAVAFVDNNFKFIDFIDRPKEKKDGTDILNLVNFSVTNKGGER